MKKKTIKVEYFLLVVIAFIIVIFLHKSGEGKKIITANTVSNVEKCIKKESSDLVSSKVVRNACIEKIQKINPSEDTGGKAGYKYNENNKAKAFSGNIRNNMDDFIITQYTVSVAHYVNYGDASISCKEAIDKEKRIECRKIIHEDTFKKKWIEPNESEKFYLSLKHTLRDETEENINFEILRENIINKGKKGNYTWIISDIYGVRIFD